MIKRVQILFLALCMVVLCSSYSLAHPPREIVFSRDQGQLNVKILHSVEDPSKHYINKIVVTQNDKVILQKDFTQQKSVDSQDFSFSIPDAKSGDTIKVTATCVIFGSTVATYLVP